MSEEVRLVVDQAFHLARQMRTDRRWFTPLVALYWKLAFISTRILEKRITQHPVGLQNDTVLNFGCGNRFYVGAVNSDLFTPHRYIKRKRRPDLFWSGVTELEYLRGRFKGVVCEHVIEHMLPDNALNLFKNFFRVLAPAGVIVISFPDIHRVLANGDCQGYSSSMVALNSVVYRHGHTFMYDKDMVCELLRQAGFSEIEVTSFERAPLPEFLDPNREFESAYIVAKRR